MPMFMQLSFQDAAAYSLSSLIIFHDIAMVIIVLILSMVGYMMGSIMFSRIYSRYIISAHSLEVYWTVLPGLVLVALAFPSLRILYLADELKSPAVTVKIVGHQWYWSYEYSDFSSLEYDSYMVGDSDLSDGMFRLLEVDHRFVIPSSCEVRLLVSSSDVIHAWALPSLGMKVDAVPGRLNQLVLPASFPGIYYGQCSEICGANHSFMPIVVEVVDLSTFLSWVSLN